MTNTTTYLSDYKKACFDISEVYLDFDLYDDYVVVKNTMQLERTSKGELSLAGDSLELTGIQINDKPLDSSEYTLTEDNLIIKNCPDEFKLTITTRIYPQNNTQLSGLFRTNNLFCTQCEAEGFRRITYFYDRPDVMSKYHTKISADKDSNPVLLSNGNLIESGENPDGRHWVIWQDPFKKPSYLFALVAGKLSHIEDKFITKSQKSIDLRIYVEPKDIDKCQHAMTSLKKAMRWDEEEYGREYDLATFMIVAVSDFNMGAMENKGLNIFNSKFILASETSATDADYAGIEGVVAHEYFHNWTGNRITCRDWFQLSLKEGLTVFRDQEFSRDMNSRDVCRIQDVKILRQAQFPEDASPMAHPVRPTSYEEISNFYTATIYNKGAEVIRMQHTLLGKDGFRKGMDLYFKRHDGNAVTINDFVAAMEDANNADLSQFKNWYDQARTPIVTVKSSFKDNRLTLKLSQSCQPSPECQNKKPFHIPIKVALFDDKGQQLQIENEIIELKEQTQSFHFDGLTAKPTASLLRDFSAPVTLHTEDDEQSLLTILQYETDGFAKWNAAHNLAMTSLLSCYAKDQESWSIASGLISAYKNVLTDEQLDLALIAEILTVPGFEDMANEISLLDVSRAEDVRSFFKKELGAQLYPELKATYERLWQQEKHSMDNKDYGPRKLRNTCLQLMMCASEEETLIYCQKQFLAAKTMSDQLASLTLLVNCSKTEIREQALADFYGKWQHDELVIDKWFSVQAAANVDNVLTHVEELQNHKDYNIKNPNRLRSLIMAFVQANPKYFHAIDGSGYRFLTKVIIEIDKINPQLSSRITTPYTRWQRLDIQRQELIKTELKLLDKMDLSKDLTEIVSKSLSN
ncbi:MAG: aminopeptidase N [Legionellaceae bacterium]|nr:aminopeptidase N [Legionellaceae bacterium]